MSSVATEPDFTEDGFYIDFPKMLGYVYCNIVGFKGASVLRSDQPCRRRVIKGDEFIKTAPAPPLLRRAPAPLKSLPRLRPVRVPKLASAILRPAMALCRARRLLSQAAAADE